MHSVHHFAGFCRCCCVRLSLACLQGCQGSSHHHEAPVQPCEAALKVSWRAGDMLLEDAVLHSLKESLLQRPLKFGGQARYVRCQVSPQSQDAATMKPCIGSIRHGGVLHV